MVCDCDEQGGILGGKCGNIHIVISFPSLLSDELIWPMESTVSSFLSLRSTLTQKQDLARSPSTYAVLMEVVRGPWTPTWWDQRWVRGMTRKLVSIWSGTWCILCYPGRFGHRSSIHTWQWGKFLRRYSCVSWNLCQQNCPRIVEERSFKSISLNALTLHLTQNWTTLLK